MIILDTDHVTVLEFEEDQRCAPLKARIAAAPDTRTVISVITVEEQMRGWMADLARQRDLVRQIVVYERLATLFQFFAKWEIVPFDARAAVEFQRL